MVFGSTGGRGLATRNEDEMTDELHQDTRAAQGASVKLDQRPMALPVYRSAVFRTQTVREFDAISGLQQEGYVYSRDRNPTSDAFAVAVGELESVNVSESIDADSFASGKAAVSSTILSFVRTGDEIICSKVIYNGTGGFLTGLATRLGIRTSFVNFGNLREVELAVEGAGDRAKLLFVETIANPTLAVADLAALAKLAHNHGLLFVVDSTFTSPAICRPLEFGADVVIHSATKFIGGHGDATGGVAVGRSDLIAEIRETRKALGGSLAPDEAFMLHRGLLTLPLRMRRHSESALYLAQALESHEKVKGVSYPGLASHPDHALVQRQFEGGLSGGVVALSLEGGAEEVATVCDRLQLISIATSVGSVHSKASRVGVPRLGQGEQDQAPEFLLRLSVGLEDPGDLLRDMVRALESV